MNASSLAAPEERDRLERSLEMDAERGEADDAPTVEEGTEAEHNDVPAASETSESI